MKLFNIWIHTDRSVWTSGPQCFNGINQWRKTVTRKMYSPANSRVSSVNWHGRLSAFSASTVDGIVIVSSSGGGITTSLAEVTF